VRDGLLFASEAIGEGARGTAVSDAREGEDVCVSNIDGTVEMKIGEITILKVPGIQRGGSKSADLDRLKKEINGRRMIGAIGIEALIALRRIGAEPHCFYGVKEAAIEAAHCGLSPLVVCVDDEVPGLLQGLGEENFNYETLDLGKSNHTDM
jgi:putative transcriptional regulator